MLRLDEAVDKVVQVGRGAFLAKLDLQSAYRNVPVHPEDLEWCWMVSCM